LAVLFLDLDRFKVVNDSLDIWWEPTADRSRRLEALLRSVDTLAVSGDEFTILLEDIEDIGAVTT